MFGYDTTPGHLRELTSWSVIVAITFRKDLLFVCVAMAEQRCVIGFFLRGYRRIFQIAVYWERYRATSLIHYGFRL